MSWEHVKEKLEVYQQHNASLSEKKHHHKTEQSNFTRTPNTIVFYFWDSANIVFSERKENRFVPL